MNNPFTDKPMKLLRVQETKFFRKEEFIIVHHSYLCEDTNEKYITEEQEHINIEQLHNAYKAKHNIPSAHTIQKIREQYGISAAKMSELMEFGINTYKQYEDNEIPSLSNARLIKTIAAKPSRFKEQVLDNQNIKEKEKQELLDRIKVLMVEEENNKVDEILMASTNVRPNISTGHVALSLIKFFNVLAYFATEMQPYKTKMNKLLFYADFWHFQKHGISISGAQYRAIQYGPVPADYQFLYGYGSKKQYVEIEEQISTDNAIVSEQFKKGSNGFDSSIFEKEELETLERVNHTFKKFTTKQIIERSHQEKAWIENQELHNLIDYNYAFEMNV